MTRAQSTLYAKCATALRAGYFWCIACQHIVEPENYGEAQSQCCPECGSHHITWNPPALPHDYFTPLNQAIERTA